MKTKSWRMAILTAGLLAVSALIAQTTNGRIVGSVADSSGAVVAGTKVAARSLATNRTETAQAGDSGNYVFPNLLIGAYEITAEAPGLKHYVQSPVELQVDQTVRVDIHLQLGDVAEQVTVVGDAPLIQTDQSSVGQVIENRTVVERPLTGAISSAWAA